MTQEIEYYDKHAYAHNKFICPSCFYQWSIDMRQYNSTIEPVYDPIRDALMFFEYESKIHNFYKRQSDKKERILREDREVRKLLENKFSEARILTNIIMDFV